jgi:hypothetical protein
MKAVIEDMIGAADLVVTLGREVSVGEVEGEGCRAQPGQGDTEVFDAVGPTLLRAAVMTRGESWGPLRRRHVAVLAEQPRVDQ